MAAASYRSSPTALVLLPLPARNRAGSGSETDSTGAQTPVPAGAASTGGSLAGVVVPVEGSVPTAASVEGVATSSVVATATSVVGVVASVASVELISPRKAGAEAFGLGGGRLGRVVGDVLDAQRSQAWSALLEAHEQRLDPVTTWGGQARATGGSARVVVRGPRVRRRVRLHLDRADRRRGGPIELDRATADSRDDIVEGDLPAEDRLALLRPERARIGLDVVDAWWRRQRRGGRRARRRGRRAGRRRGRAGRRRGRARRGRLGDRRRGRRLGDRRRRCRRGSGCGLRGIVVVVVSGIVVDGRGSVVSTSSWRRGCHAAGRRPVVVDHCSGSSSSSRRGSWWSSSRTARSTSWWWLSQPGGVVVVEPPRRPRSWSWLALPGSTSSSRHTEDRSRSRPSPWRAPGRRRAWRQLAGPAMVVWMMPTRRR